MFQPVLWGLDKIIEKAVPRFLDETLETRILLLIDHLYKKTPMVAPMEKLDYSTESKPAYIPTATWKRVG